MSSIPALNLAGAISVAGNNTELQELLVTGFKLTHVLQVYTSATMAVAVWDWIVCLGMEYDRIWKRAWTPVKFLYIWTRYYGLVCFAVNLWLFNDNFTTERCKTLHFLIAATCMWVTMGSDAILAVRTYAFLLRDKKVIIGLGILLTGECAYLLYVSIAGVFQVPILIGTEGPCTASDFPGKHVVSGFWLAPVAFNLICTGLTLMKVIQMRRLSTMPIIATFVREGIFYFLAVSAVNVLNAAFMFQSNANIQNINALLALILTQVLCCRMVLNLRKPASQMETNTFSGRSGQAQHQPRSTAHGNSRVAIPLNTLTSATHYDFSNQVKVQVDVERDQEESKPEKWNGGSV
ncbi:hypothetical protein PENSPDRAFT_657506 [Peniophora sp. CONT]|nr:hypothetical protein PENSPDRAFT_657506 [Peniophora sp. CONT]